MFSLEEKERMIKWKNNCLGEMNGVSVDILLLLDVYVCAISVFNCIDISQCCSGVQQFLGSIFDLEQAVRRLRAPNRNSRARL